MSKKIKKILIANRGEIAIRVAQTCRELGIKTISIFTNEELSLPHATISDENINLGEGTLADLLKSRKINQACPRSKSRCYSPRLWFLK